VILIGSAGLPSGIESNNRQTFDVFWKKRVLDIQVELAARGSFEV
jgi:hypothetical protein